MKRAVLTLIAVGVLVSGGVVAWFFSIGNAEPSTELTAPPVSTTAIGEVPFEDSLPSNDSSFSTTVPSNLYSISSDLSQVTFTLQEELRGADTIVVGTTDQVAGEIIVDLDNPAASALGEVVINARTFTTGTSNRDRAVRGAILDSDNFEFITFVPTSLDGLPTEPADSFDFTITGDLTIRDFTQSVVFEVAVSGSADGVEGTATVVVNRTDFELNIPNVPAVANVSEEVTLSIEFVALPG